MIAGGVFTPCLGPGSRQGCYSGYQPVALAGKLRETIALCWWADTALGQVVSVRATTATAGSEGFLSLLVAGFRQDRTAYGPAATAPPIAPDSSPRV